MSVPFQRHVLSNGLRLIVHEDHTTPLASCNVVYNVGSRDEHPNHTGLAHLFEHYMFCGSRNIGNYDKPLQKIGAINNAYTSQDITHYYIVLPANNIETALWLESDRMLELAFNQKELDIQKSVVIEEFKETSLNRPFGDLWCLFNDFIYENYPYKWLPIGKEISHIQNVTMDMMKDFFYKYYRPNNAVLVVSGNVYFTEVIQLVEKWFGSIPQGSSPSKNFSVDEPQETAKVLEVKRKVPYDMLMKGWKMGPRLDPDFYAYDLLSDLLGTGQSSYLYEKFVTEQHLFTDISASVTATNGPGIFVLSARPADGINLVDANRQLNDYLYQTPIFDDKLDYHLQKVKNRCESCLLNNEIKMENRSSILAVSETISKIEDFDNEIEQYRDVTTDDVLRISRFLLQEKNDNTLFYLAEKD